MPKFPVCGTGVQPETRTTTDSRTGKIAAPDKKRAAEWSAHEVAAWISDVGYPSYAELFLSNHIDGSILLGMGRDDFQNMTITSVGHIKTLMRKIDELNDIVKLSQQRSSALSDRAGNTAGMTSSAKISSAAGGDGSGRSRSSSRESDHRKKKKPSVSSSSRHRRHRHDSSSDDDRADRHSSKMHSKRGAAGGSSIGSSSSRRRKYPESSSSRRGGSDPNHWDPPTKEIDRKRDRDMYLHLWDKVVGHRDLMDEKLFRSLNVSLPIDTVKLIWSTIMGNQKRGGHSGGSASAARCDFDEFAAMLKLTALAQMSVPSFVIRLDKLNEFHPKPPTMSFESTTKEQSRQMSENMVSFVGIPTRVLDRDEKLMQLEKHALRKFSPIHFEINGAILVATFRTRIQERELDQLRWHTHRTLKDMGYSAEELSRLTVRMPTASDLGTPAGPTPGGGPIPSAYPMGPPSGHPSYGADMRGAPMTGGMYPPPPPYKGAPYAGGVIQPDPFAPQMHAGAAGPSTTVPLSAVSTGVPPSSGAGLPPPIAPARSRSPMVLPTIITRVELAKMTRGDFWEEFNRRTEIEQEFASSDTIRTRSAISIIAKLRGVPTKQVNFRDKGVSFISNLTLSDLKRKLSKPPKVSEMAVLLNVNIEEFPDCYKGIEIEGLPADILARDDTLHLLDERVLSAFEVLQIEVVGLVKLQIGFADLITERDLDDLRKRLKTFLNDTLGVHKSVLKGITILPHPIASWQQLAAEAEKMEAEMVGA